ncbi:MAG: carbon-nitrogen hydrolase family protein [Acidimicrobiales bacterium]
MSDAPASQGEVDLFAVQPRVGLDEYLRPGAFEAHHRALAGRVAALREVAGGEVPALAVWPEYVATFLVLTGLQREVEGCTTTAQVLRRAVAGHLPAICGVMARHRTLRLGPAVLTMLAPAAHQVYVDTFAGIARDFGMWVVAGSGLFPRNRFADVAGRYAAASAHVFNTSYTFDPTGRVVAMTRKVNLVPTQEDVLHLSAAPVGELEALDTPFGRIGTLICYDGFHEAHTGAEPAFERCAPVLDRLGVEIVAQPSANAWAWDAPWVFNDVGESLLRSEQWFAEGMARELAELSSVRYVVSPQLVGAVLDSHFEGPSLVLGQGPGGVEVLARASDIAAEDVLHVRVRR